MFWTLTFVIREPWAYQRQKNTDTAQAVQQVPQVAGAAQLAALLHCCSLVLNIGSPVHISGVIQHASSGSLCIVAEHQARAQGFLAVDQQSGCSGGLIK